MSLIESAEFQQAFRQFYLDELYSKCGEFRAEFENLERFLVLAHQVFSKQNGNVLNGNFNRIKPQQIIAEIDKQLRNELPPFEVLLIKWALADKWRKETTSDAAYYQTIKAEVIRDRLKYPLRIEIGIEYVDAGTIGAWKLVRNELAQPANLDPQKKLYKPRNVPKIMWNDGGENASWLFRQAVDQKYFKADLRLAPGILWRMFRSNKGGKVLDRTALCRHFPGSEVTVSTSSSYTFQIEWTAIQLAYFFYQLKAIGSIPTEEKMSSAISKCFVIKDEKGTKAISNKTLNAFFSQFKAGKKPPEGHEVVDQLLKEYKSRR